MKSLHATLAVTLISGMALAGCGDSTPTAQSTSHTSTAVTTTASMPPAPTMSASTASPTPDITQSATTDPTDPASPDEPLTTPSAPAPVRSGDVVHLSNIFATEGEWEENRFGFAGKSAVPGIATTVTSCGKDSFSNASIELRLEDRFTNVSFDVAQSDNSQSSDQRLTTEIIANGNQIDIDTVGFNKIKHYTANVTNVNALKIRFFLDDTVETCSSNGSVEAVISNLIVK